MGDVAGNLTVVGDGWQLDVFQESAPFGPPVEATGVHIIARGGEGGTATGRGRDGYVVVFTEIGDGPQADPPAVHVHNAPGGAGGSGRGKIRASGVQVTVGRGGAGGATPGGDGQSGQSTGGGVGGAGGKGGGGA